MLAFFALFLGICVLGSKAHDSADIWGGSRIFLVTDLRNSTIDVEKLYTSFADRGLAEIFNRLVIVQRGQDGRFINSHGSLKTLSRVQERTFWSISRKEILPWLLEENPGVIICVGDNTDVPQILISAKRNGVLPLETKLMIWMIKRDNMAADAVNEVSLTSPGDLDLRPSRLDNDVNRLALRRAHLISARNLEGAIMEVFQRVKGDVHHRDKRDAAASNTNTATAAGITIPTASPTITKSMSTSLADNVTVATASPPVEQSMSASVTTYLTGPIATATVTTASPAVKQSMSTLPGANVTVTSASPAVKQSMSTLPGANVTVTSASPAVKPSMYTLPGAKVTVTTASPAVKQSMSTLPGANVTVATASPIVKQSMSASVTTNLTGPIATPTVSQSISIFAAVSSTESASSMVSKSKSTPMVVTSFTASHAVTVTSRVFIKPSSPASSLMTPAISPFSSSVLAVPSELPSTSSRKTSVVATSKPIVSPSAPLVSTKLPPTSSVETSSSSLKLLSSSLASKATELSTSAVVSPTSTKRLPSFSSAMVTQRPPVYENKTFFMEFAGDCNDVVGKNETVENFRTGFVNEVAKKLGITESTIVVSDVACGSIRVTFTIIGASGKPNVSQELKKLVENGDISVTVNNKTFKAFKFTVERPTTQSSVVATTISPTASVKGPVTSTNSVVQPTTSSTTATVTGPGTSTSVVQPTTITTTATVTGPGTITSVVQPTTISTTANATGPVTSTSVVQPTTISTTANVTGPVTSTSVVQRTTISTTTNVTGPVTSTSVVQRTTITTTATVTGPVTSTSVAQRTTISTTANVTGQVTSTSVVQRTTISTTATVTGLVTSTSVVQPTTISTTANVTGPVTSTSVVQPTTISTTANVTAPVTSIPVVQPTPSSTTANVTGPVTSTPVVQPTPSSGPVTSTPVVQPTPSSTTASVTGPGTSTPVVPSTSSGKTVATSQSTVSPSAPVTSTKLPPTSSVVTKSTSLKLLSSFTTSRSIQLSTSAVISPTSTKREPLPSSSFAVVTEKPPVYENETIVVEFEGDCNDVVGKKETEEKFRKEFVNEVAGKLGIAESTIVVSDVACGSIRVTFTITGASGKPNVSQELKKLVENGDISVTVNNKTFKASKLEVVRPTIPSTVVPTTESKNEIAFILYITFGALMGFIFIVGIIVLFVRCRRDRHEGSFYLTNETNYELRRFQGIPRANSYYSKVNYYGEPVEMDATAADPDAEDEFQAGAGAYPYDLSPANAGGKPRAAANGDSKEEKFNVGTMGLPEWKNLPKLSQKEIAVAEPKEDIPKSSGSVGSRELLLESESAPEDSRHAYDNPVLTFGDGPTGLDKEDS